ncbi:Transposable element Tc3 transposase [Araneus ventricosus]|uniref:Transposable element Tc3 transposase n=1 Tax=Araneus ventricosus TaxID=182803 RepID=A0A4Y2J5G5_ARAVE|nr:Transposable element Tc3 transposase [Araneus ventricosus]
MYNTFRRYGSYIYAEKLPQLLQRHKIERLNFSQQGMTWNNQWIRIIFSGEKKWNLDGPDERKYHWHDLRKEKEIFSKCQLGGCSVMTWGCFSYNGVGSIAFVSGKMNSRAYQSVLASHLSPNAGENWKCQPDNAPTHSSNSTKNWFQVNNVETLKWPAKSPDLNTIKNVWGDFSRRVYANGRNFTSSIELKSTIEDEWYETNPQLCQKKFHP